MTNIQGGLRQQPGADTVSDKRRGLGNSQGQTKYLIGRGDGLGDSQGQTKYSIGGGGLRQWPGADTVSNRGGGA